MPLIRALRNAQKHYCLDWSMVPGDGPRFENLVARRCLVSAGRPNESPEFGHSVAILALPILS